MLPGSRKPASEAVDVIVFGAGDAGSMLIQRLLMGFFWSNEFRFPNCIQDIGRDADCDGDMDGTDRSKNF